MKQVVIPEGKALIAVTVKKPINDKNAHFVGDPGHKSICDSCFFDKYFSHLHTNPCKLFKCGGDSDDHKIVYQLIDYGG